MPSSTATKLRASGSASSIAAESSDRARVPSWTWVRSASRASRAACSGSSVTFSRWPGLSMRTSVLHGPARNVYPSHLSEAVTWRYCQAMSRSVDDDWVPDEAEALLDMDGRRERLEQVVA